MNTRPFIFSLPVIFLLSSMEPLEARPNILIAITDDQSWEHAGAYGADWIDTPHMDGLAREGIRFTHAYSQVPSCSPSRATLLTGRQPWQLAEGSTLWSTVPARYASLMDVLADAGYHTGYTRKGWGPGSDTLGGRNSNPAGRGFNSFDAFLNNRSAGAPFCFWFGTQDPHRPYSEGIGLRSGRHTLEEVEVPAFLADTSVTRSDLLDYGWEIERFDSQLGAMLQLLEDLGELENTIVLVTSDNGMPFPGAKSNLYDHGVRVPLIVRWPTELPGGVVSERFTLFADIMPTLLTGVGVEIPETVTGESLWEEWTNPHTEAHPVRAWAPLYLARHSHCRFDMQGYPMRGIRTKDFLYIRNFEPDRWPSGDPPNHRDIDGSPSKDVIDNNRELYPDLFARCFAKRPEEELYAVGTDPYSMANLASDPEYGGVLAGLRQTLMTFLREEMDPQVLGYGFLLEGNPYTRGSFNERYGGVEVLGRYHPIRKQEFLDWVGADADGDGLKNLFELAAFGNPVSPRSRLTPAAFEDPLVFSVVEGSWPWEWQIVDPMGLPSGAVQEAGQFQLPFPASGSAFLQLQVEWQFAAF